MRFNESPKKLSWKLNYTQLIKRIVTYMYFMFVNVQMYSVYT